MSTLQGFFAAFLVQDSAIPLQAAFERAEAMSAAWTAGRVVASPEVGPPQRGSLVPKPVPSFSLKHTCRSSEQRPEPAAGTAREVPAATLEMVQQAAFDRAEAMAAEVRPPCCGPCIKYGPSSSTMALIASGCGQIRRWQRRGAAG